MPPHPCIAAVTSLRHTGAMEKNRLEAFSDGVIAIIITIMVLELKVPEVHVPLGDQIKELLPVLLSYVLSFIYVGIYWNNHHHLLHTTRRVSGMVLWANLHLLFWLSLFPFATAWVGANHLAPVPTAFYAFILLMAGFAYYLLEKAIIRFQGSDSPLAQAVGSAWKEKLSLIGYLLGMVLAFCCVWASQILFVLVAILWLIPDRRIERRFSEKSEA